MKGVGQGSDRLKGVGRSLTFLYKDLFGFQFQGRKHPFETPGQDPMPPKIIMDGISVYPDPPG